MCFNNDICVVLVRIKIFSLLKWLFTMADNIVSCRNFHWIIDWSLKSSLIFVGYSRFNNWILQPRRCYWTNIFFVIAFNQKFKMYWNIACFKTKSLGLGTYIYHGTCILRDECSQKLDNLLVLLFDHCRWQYKVYFLLVERLMGLANNLKIQHTDKWDLEYYLKQQNPWSK